MKLTINGETREAGQVKSLTDLLVSLSLPSKMVVVEHNAEIVPRDKYGETWLAEGDQLEIVQMMAGG